MMEEQNDSFGDDVFFTRRPEMKTQEEREEELKQVLRQTTGFVDWSDDEEPKVVKKETKLQKKLDSSPIFTDKRFQQTIEGRKSADYVMSNVATSNNAAYLNVISSQQEKVEEKSANQKKRERRAGCCKSSYAWDVAGRRITDMEDSKDKIMSEEKMGRRPLDSRVGETQTEKVEVNTKETQVEASVTTETFTQTSAMEEVISVMSNPEGVDLIKPYQNMPVEVKKAIHDILTAQFDKCGLKNEGWSPIFGAGEESWYSVSFTQGDRVPDFADADEINQLLSQLNLNSTIAWGLRRIQPYIAVTSKSLDRWQVTLEVLSADELERERQMVRMMLSGVMPNFSSRPATPKVEKEKPDLQSSEEEASDTEKPESPNQQEKEEKLTQRQKMRKLFNVDPNTIVNSPKHGKITVTEWFKLQHKQRKEKKKAKTVVTNEDEVLRNESNNATPPPQTPPRSPKTSFSDDSISREVPAGSLKDKMEHRENIKKNPDKVKGQRKWEEGKGAVKQHNFAQVLQSNLQPSEQVIVFRPPPIPEPVVIRKRIPKCPIPGIPQRKWREERLEGKTEEEINEIAKQLLRRMIRSEVRFLRGRWLSCKIRERNSYLVTPEEVIKVVEANSKEHQWESFKDWQTAAKEVKPQRGTPAQMNWSAYVPRPVDSGSEN